MGTKAKPKRRNSDKRKEKSRDAARNRRGKEAEIFGDLAALLPLSQHMADQLDKASIMRLAISHLKIQSLLNRERSISIKEEQCEEAAPPKVDQYYLRAMDGFLVVLDVEGEMVYLSDNITKYLGLAQVDLIGHSLYDFSHPCDHDELKEVIALSFSSNSEKEETDTEIFLRMKCTLTSKGRNLNLKSATYKVVRMSGRLVEGAERKKYLVLVGENIPHPSNIEILLDSKTFLSRHEMDMKFTYCDDRVKLLLGYSDKDMMGRCLYNFHHAADSQNLEKAYKNLITKGQCVTERYRFMAKRGGFAWVQTQATVIYNTKTDKPQCVVCVHYLLSEVEERETTYSYSQVKARTEPILPTTSIFKPLRTVETASQEETGREKEAGKAANRFIHSTANIFRMKTKDMDTEFYMPEGHDKNDLRHLAPNAGDVHVPLAFPGRGVMTGLCDDLMTQIANSDDDVAMSPDQTNIPMTDSDEATTCSPTPTPPPTTTSTGGPTTISTGSNVSSTVTSSGTGMKCVESTTSLRTTASSISLPLSASISIPDMSEFMTELEQEIDFDMRAPYIPMSGDADLIFTAGPIPLSHEYDDGPDTCMGITETVFTPKPPELCPPSITTPFSVLKQQMLGEQRPKLPVGEQAVCLPKVKRPLETNTLETGPPAKVSKPGPGIGKKSHPSVVSRDTNKVSSSSVLMNLLLNGEDAGNGYQRPGASPPRDKDSPCPADNVVSEETVVTSELPQVQSLTLDASTLEQLQRLVSNNGPGSLIVLTPSGVCMIQTPDIATTQ